MYSNKVINYQTTNPIKIKSLEELQADAKKRNDAEADKLCNNIKLCCGWSCCLGLFCWAIAIIIKTTFFFTPYEKNAHSILILEEVLTSSGSN